MATSAPVQAPAAPAPAPNRPPAEAATEQGLVRAPFPAGESEALEQILPMARLPVEVDVTIPIRGFRVRNLLAIAIGQIVESSWVDGEDVPLSAGDVQLAWSEFEVIDTQLGVRVTRLA
jgi:flagellar motor switch protein FliN/FliY